MKHIQSKFQWPLLLAFLSVFSLDIANAQFLVTPQPGEIFKEYAKIISVSSDDFRVTDPNSPDVRAQGYLPNHTLSLNGVDLVDASRAEVVIDMWGGHAGTTGKKLRFNNNAWITIPEMGAGNGIPAGHNGECYVQQFNPTVAIPLNNLVQNNTFQGTSGGQTCYNFDWGQWGWYGIILRVYYNNSKPHPTGSITSHNSGGAFGDNPTITATTVGGTQVDFLAYYNGFDSDGDGVSQQYHHSYHRTKTDATFIMRNHVGSDNSSPFSATWNTDLVPDQVPGSVKFIARIKDANGVWFMTNEITNLSLQRSNSSVKIYRVTDVPERFWVRNGRTPRTVHFTIPAGDNLANATTNAYLLMTTWNGNDLSENANTSIKVNNHTFADFGTDHFYSYDIVSFPKTALNSGQNSIVVTANTAEHGIEGLWPGPAVIVKYNVAAVNTPPSITQDPVNRNIGVGETAQFSVNATGSVPLAFKWQKNNVDIPGATSSSYTTPAAILGDNGSLFRCIVTNSFGADTSQTALLTVSNLKPTITQQPANRNVVVGQTATFSVVASGTQPLSYQWRLNGGNIGGATNSSYTTPPTTLANSGEKFSCFISNIAGDTLSNDAELIVTEVPPPSANVLLNGGFESGSGNWTFYTNGSGNYAVVPSPIVEAGNVARLTINTIGSNTQFYQSGVTLDANTNYTLTFSAYSSDARDLAVSLQQHVSPNTNYGLNNVLFNLTSGWQTFTIQFNTTGFAGTVTDGRLRFVLNNYPLAGSIYFIDDVVLQKTSVVVTPPSISTHPSNQAVTEGQQATFSVVAAGTPPLTFQWQKNNVDIPGANGASYTTPATTLANNGETFRCRVTNSANNVTSNPATLTVNPAGALNVLLNGGFESGSGNWTFYTNGSGNYAVVPSPIIEAGNVARLTINTVGSNTQFYQSSIPLDANTNYTLTFSAFSSNARDLAVSLQRHDTPFTNYGLNNILFNLTSGWQTFTVQFNTTGFAGTVNNGRLRFVFNNYPLAGTQYFIDDVVLAKTNAGPVAPTINTHPQSQAVLEGATATFNVGATGTAPLSYQWQKNNVDIGGATNTSYTTPPTTPGDNGTTYRCVVTNPVNSTTSNPATLTVNPPPPPGSNWWNILWSYRTTVTVSAGAFERKDKPAEVVLNFTQLLSGIGVSGAFNPNSIRVIEVSNAEAILDTAVAFQFDKAATYHASTNASGNLVLMLKGTTAANATRTFNVYFDVVGTAFTLPSITPLVNHTGDVAWQGQTSFRIVTSKATYYYHKEGGGFASMIDNNAKDWLSYNTTPGYAGDYRGMPNLGDVYHPGYTNSSSTIENPGPVKLTIRSVSDDGLWEGTWEVFNDHVRFTLLEKGANYWFLVEGTPGGTYSLTDYVVRSNGLKTPASLLWAGDMAAPEWVYFGDPAMSRVMYAVHHENDSQPEYYRDGSGAMTVFGFGRDNVTCCPRFLSVVPQHFTVGFSEDSSYAGASKAINSAYQPLGTTVSSAEVRPPAPFGGNTPTNAMESGLPTEFALDQNFPNPFNPSTTIRYALPNDVDVTLTIYDVLGQEVVTLIDGFHVAGRYEAQLHGLNLSSGIYLYRLQAGSFVETRRLTLIK
ncbi:MAG: immunoglobulin domain-containing protein [Bacteroidota bacterium]